MDSRYFHKTKSSTYAELHADRGHPGPKILLQGSIDFWIYRASKLLFPNGKISTANLSKKIVTSKNSKMPETHPKNMELIKIENANLKNMRLSAEIITTNSPEILQKPEKHFDEASIIN